MPEFMARPMPWKPAGWVLCYCGRKAKLVREAYIGVGGFVHNTGRMWEWSRRKNKWMAAKKNRRHRKKITKAMDKVILPIPYRVVK